jgi:hypothetical protein
MFNRMVLCSVGAGLAISLAACGQSDEAKCKEFAKSQHDSALNEDMNKTLFDVNFKNCMTNKQFGK